MILILTFLTFGTLQDAMRDLQTWQLEPALNFAQTSLNEKPDDPLVWLLAGRVQFFRGEHLSALSLLKAAEKAGIESDDLMILVKNVARYQTQFKTLETKHFKISYLDKDEVVAVYAEPVLEQAYTAIGQALEFLPAEKGEKIAVEIYPNAETLSEATGLTLKEIETSGTIAVCKFHRLMITSPLAIANGYLWADTLAHELTHLIVSKKSLNTIPIWLHEGIAKYYESLWSGRIGQALQPYSENLLYEAVVRKKLIPFAKMHPSMAKLPSQQDTALAFAEVFTMIEFIHKKYGLKSIAKILELARDKHDLNAILNTVLGVELKQLETLWKNYLKQRTYRKTTTSSPEKIVLAHKDDNPTAERPLEPIKEKRVHDLSRLGELLQLQNHPQAAVIEYEKAFTLSGFNYPTLINRLARAYVAIHKEHKALQLLNQNLEFSSRDSDARLLLARILLNQKNYTEAQTHFQALLLQNPFNPEIHSSLQTIYEKQNAKRLAEQEQLFFELCSEPRKPLKLSLPVSNDDLPRISVFTANWSKIRIDGNLPLATPLWEYSIPEGEHSIEYNNAQGQSETHNLRVNLNDNVIVQLP